MDKALESGKLFEMEGWKYLEPAAKEHTLHLIGLLSDGGVHSRYDQLWLLIQGVRPPFTPLPKGPPALELGSQGSLRSHWCEALQSNGPLNLVKGHCGTF